jgi:hypothetical protein
MGARPRGGTAGDRHLWSERVHAPPSGYRMDGWTRVGAGRAGRRSIGTAGGAGGERGGPAPIHIHLSSLRGFAGARSFSIPGKDSSFGSLIAFDG